MALSIEKTGKTVQHAINEALEKLGVSADDVVIEVLDEGESGGLLGIGRRPAKVRVTQDDLAGTLSAHDQLSAGMSMPADESGASDVQQEQPAAYYGDDEINEDEQADDTGYQETPEEGESTAYIAAILSGIGIHGRISSYREDDTIYIDVAGEDCGAAIGRHGETLDALQYLATLVANKISEDRIRVILDIDGYRQRRESSLIDLADRTAEKVLDSGKPYRLQPMSPAERRIVHSSLQRFDGIITYSEGNDPQRRVVVAPAAEE